MKIDPGFDSFADRYKAGKNQVLWTRRPADLDTPVSLLLKLTGAGRHAFVLESVTGGEVRGRYSIVGMDPDLIWRCKGTTSEVNRNARWAEEFTPCEGGPLEALRALLAESRIDLPEALPAASAGLFGYLGYDMIRLVERLGEPGPDPIGLPDALLMRPTVVAVLDGVKGEVILVAPVWADSDVPPRAAYAQAAERLSVALRALDGPVPVQPSVPVPSEPPAATSNFTHEGYLDAVRTAKDYIRAGDIFQVVPSQRWTQEYTLPPFALYRSLRRTNPSPFMYYMNLGDAQIVGASPEILVRVMDGDVTIRPIAGTRPRGKDKAEDQALADDLLSDEKEMAEHLMLLDLGRNDVGRVSKIGTVRPTEQFVIEHFSHVMHITSNVVGELSPEHDALSALLAGLPAGTLSGAPKVRAMEIIDELEPEKRGLYGGGLGYFSAGGDMDMCIVLRTAILKDGKLYMQAGGGVVHDSDPEAEYQETIHKTNALRRAVDVAAEFADSGN